MQSISYWGGVSKCLDTLVLIRDQRKERVSRDLLRRIELELQRVQRETKDTPLAVIVADSLTKALNHSLHQAFIQQLGLAQPLG